MTTINPSRKLEALALISAAGNEGATVRDLSESMCMTKSGVGRYIKQLRDAGLITEVGQVPGTRIPIYMAGDGKGFVHAERKTTKDIIMDFLNENGDSTAQQIVDAHPEVNYNTVATMITKLRHLNMIETKIPGRGGRPAVYGLGLPDASLDGDIFEQCKRNWGGYHIHKIFGSAGRVSA
ncbi:ArsR family transcriptional regulator [Citrobacter werkmanii]|jgi:predicted transcriptional regulator|uniref:ArsR family transcriptional regulator n=1 Tax=Citrobacter werkmanii TaxID=67827 RepID=UPI002885F37C|nr:MarR family transcriptional regulator [Citrobacter werkmanii]MDT0637678.1 ArsR family transcriptional regulator [Citrobacter werkmanii]